MIEYFFSFEHICEWNSSVSQLRSNPKTIPERGTDDDDDDDEN